MALSRRSGQRFQASIWPGFVDAMTGLLLVLMFVLTIFMVVQFVLSEKISGQETKLDALSLEIAALAQALGLEQDKSASLEDRVGALTSTLSDARQQRDEQANLIFSLQQERDAQDAALSVAQAQIASFEQQVAGLLADREDAQGQIAALEGEREQLMSEQDALQLALASLRDEIDVAAESARLAAAQREALDALVADLRRENAEGADQQAFLDTQVADLEAKLTEEEIARIAEAAAAAALREKLSNAQTELTAMTLALEEQRREAEETLTMLAAAQEVSDDLDAQLAAALLAQLDNSGQLTALHSQLDAANAQLAALEVERTGEVETLTAEMAQLEKRLQAALAQVENELGGEISSLQAKLDAAEIAASAGKSELETMRATLAATQTELAQVKIRLATVLASVDEQTLTADEIRRKLTAALAAKLAAENDAATQLSAAEERAALLSQAREELSKQQSVNEAAQREQILLNQQVAALRTQLSELQALLDDAKIRDAAANVQLQTLSTDLNIALARAAAEERRRREAEEEKNALLEAEKENLEKYRSEFFGRLRDVLGAQDGVRIEGDRFVFSSEVLFALGEAELSNQGESEIAKVATILSNVAGEIPPEIDWIIRVDGHTDDVPIRTPEFADNWELSQARALSVVQFMIDDLGLPPSRLSANGFGEFQPINPEKTPEARAQNRRIELKFTEK